jgi:hypothetical protein
VDKYGEGQWAVISQQLNKAFGKQEDQGRIGKQCREVRAFARNAEPTWEWPAKWVAHNPGVHCFQTDLLGMLQHA